MRPPRRRVLGQYPIPQRIKKRRLSIRGSFGPMGDRVENSRLLDAATRFLYPFRWSAPSLDQAATKLADATLAIWKLEPNVPDTYHDNALQYASWVLFRLDRHHGRYLRMKTEILSALLADVSVTISGRRFGVAAQEAAGIELFLLDDGIGILSFAIQPTPASGRNGFCLTDLRDFNSYLHRAGPGVLVPTASPTPLTVGERSLGAFKTWIATPDPGSCFTLVGLRDLLLRPIVAESSLIRNSDGDGLAWPLKPSFLVYTVAHLDETFDLNDPACRRWAGPELVALRDHWPSDHAGAVSSLLPGTHLILNRRHWTAVGLEGAAVLVGDQPAPAERREHPFNPFRVGQAFEKHFFQYLLALLQRLSIHALRERALCIVIPEPTSVHGPTFPKAGRAQIGQSLASIPAGTNHESGSRKTEEQIATLRDQLLEFGLNGRFSQVQLSEAAQEVYETAVKGLRLEEAWQEARGALEEIDARRTAQRSAQSLDEIMHLQQKVEWAEVFIIGVYALEATHILTESLGWKQGYWLGVALFCIAGLGLYLAYRALNPPKEASQFQFKWLAILALIWLLLFPLRHLAPFLFEEDGAEKKSQEQGSSQRARPESDTKVLKESTTGKSRSTGPGGDSAVQPVPLEPEDVNPPPRRTSADQPTEHQVSGPSPSGSAPGEPTDGKSQPRRAPPPSRPMQPSESLGPAQPRSGLKNTSPEL
jgi:hypothetical protein